MERFRSIHSVVAGVVCGDLQWRLTPEFVVVVPYVWLAAGKLQPELKEQQPGIVLQSANMWSGPSLLPQTCSYK